MTNVNELLRDQVTLTVECMDRIYLNGYIPNLQVSGQLVNFLTKHRGHPIPSPALLGQKGLSQWSRMGQAATAAGPDRVRRAG